MRAFFEIRPGSRLRRSSHGRCGPVPASPAPILLMLLSFVLALAGPLGAQDVARQRLGWAAERLEKDRAAQLEFLAPRSFEEAEQFVERGLAAAESNGTPEQIERLADDASAALAGAERTAQRTRPILEAALEAREQAAEAGAPDFAPDDWAKAEKELEEAGRRAEREDDGATARAERAADQYRQAHRAAIRAEVLGPAAERRQEAKDAGAEKRAPITLALADTMFAEAENLLRAEPADLEQARALATGAAGEYTHAALLAVLVDSISGGKVKPEEILLRHEAQLAAIAAALEFTPRFTEGTGAVARQEVEATLSLQADRRNLLSDLDLKAAEIRSLIDRVDSLDARLADVEQREARVSAELRERERTEQRLREVRAVFDPEEAEVLVTDDRVTIRLSGLSFASGSDELGPENFDVLTKLQRVVREFPAAMITVEGHTDNVGNEAANQALSRRRAIAVRDYLLSNLAMSANRIAAVGYGQNRPIAPNDSAAGRARNRRIDVTIDVSGG